MKKSFEINFSNQYVFRQIFIKFGNISTIRPKLHLLKIHETLMMLRGLLLKIIFLLKTHFGMVGHVNVIFGLKTTFSNHTKLNRHHST